VNQQQKEFAELRTKLKN